MAKKCLLNKWEFPPMDYLDQIYNEKKALEEEKRITEEQDVAAKTKKKHWSTARHGSGTSTKPLMTAVTLLSMNSI